MLLTNSNMTPTFRRLIYYHIDVANLPVIGVLTLCDKGARYVSHGDWRIGGTRPCNRRRKSGQKRRDTVPTR